MWGVRAALAIVLLRKISAERGIGGARAVVVLEGAVWAGTVWDPWRYATSSALSCTFSSRSRWSSERRLSSWDSTVCRIESLVGESEGGGSAVALAGGVRHKSIGSVGARGAIRTYTIRPGYSILHFGIGMSGGGSVGRTRGVHRQMTIFFTSHTIKCALAWVSFSMTAPTFAAHRLVRAVLRHVPDAVACEADHSLWLARQHFNYSHVIFNHVWYRRGVESQNCSICFAYSLRRLDVRLLAVDPIQNCFI